LGPELLKNFGCYFSWSKNLGHANDAGHGQAKVNGSPRLGVWSSFLLRQAF